MNSALYIKISKHLTKFTNLKDETDYREGFIFILNRIWTISLDGLVKSGFDNQIDIDRP